MSARLFDRTVLAVMHAEASPCGRRVVLDSIDRWQGTRAAPVDLGEIREALVRRCREYHASAIVDPHEARLIARDARSAGVMVLSTGSLRRASAGSRWRCIRRSAATGSRCPTTRSCWTSWWPSGCGRTRSAFTGWIMIRGSMMIRRSRWRWAPGRQRRGRGGVDRVDEEAVRAGEQRGPGGGRGTEAASRDRSGQGGSHGGGRAGRSP